MRVAAAIASTLWIAPLAAGAAEGLYCDRVEPLNTEYRLCFTGEDAPTDSFISHVLLVDKANHLRVPTSGRYERRDAKTGVTTPFAIEGTNYYRYAGSVGLSDGNIMEFYEFDRLGHANAVYFLLTTPQGRRFINVPDGDYTKRNSTIHFTVKNGMVDGVFEETNETLEVHFPYEGGIQ